MNLSRTNKLISLAARKLGARAQPLSSEPTDYFLVLEVSGRRRIISKTRSPFLSQVAQTLANNKHVCRRLLARRGIPVIPDALVDSDEVPEIAARWLPGGAVVKPNWGSLGRGVSVGLRDRVMLERALAWARAVDHDDEAIVEPYVDGTDVRATVIGGAFEAAARIQRPRIVGDGTRPIRHLVDEINGDPRRCTWESAAVCPLDEVELDQDLIGALQVRGAGLDAVLPAGVSFDILTDEQETIDCTDELHPSWQEVAVEACRLTGVDVGGVDFRGPWDALTGPAPEAFDGRAGLLEVNVLPELHLHAVPTQGRPRPVFEAFVAYCLSLPGAPAPTAADVGFAKS